MGHVAVVGLGGMGRAIAGVLLDAGHDVVVWNRHGSAADALVARGAVRASSVGEALRASVVLSMLADDAAFTEVFLESGVLASARPGTVHANMATVSTDLAVTAAAAHASAGVSYVAAPVFGRVSVAEAGALQVLAAGEASAIDRLQPYFDAIGSRTWRLGTDPRQANTAKLLGNYLIACAIQSLGEAVSVGEAAGVDASQLVELLTSTLFLGPVYSGYGTMIAERRYHPAGFTTALGRKDLHLALDAAEAHDVPLPIGDVLRTVFEQSLAEGRGEADWASIAELQPRRSPGRAVERG